MVFSTCKQIPTFEQISTILKKLLLLIEAYGDGKLKLLRPLMQSLIICHVLLAWDNLQTAAN